ncbi:hypothetical protein SDJN02_00926, partial [Cucurbita argyrosperma subsp. argyrosperma]
MCFVQEARFSILHCARRDVVSTLYAESLILANARAAVISWMQPKMPSRKCSPDFPSCTQHAKMLVVLYDIDVEGLIFGRGIWLRGVVFAPSKQSIYFNPLLGFIRNFAWRSRLLVNQGSTRNKKNPLCIHGPQSVMEEQVIEWPI